jgi:uncharacterized membrane-anchored protein
MVEVLLIVSTISGVIASLTALARELRERHRDRSSSAVHDQSF